MMATLVRGFARDLAFAFGIYRRIDRFSEVVEVKDREIKDLHEQIESLRARLSESEEQKHRVATMLSESEDQKNRAVELAEGLKKEACDANSRACMEKELRLKVLNDCHEAVLESRRAEIRLLELQNSTKEQRIEAIKR